MIKGELRLSFFTLNIGGGRMAISNYYDVYNVKDYRIRVNDLDNSINNLINSNFYTDAINDVKHQIEILKQKKKKIKLQYLKMKNYYMKKH